MHFLCGREKVQKPEMHLTEILKSEAKKKLPKLKRGARGWVWLAMCVLELFF